MPGIGFWAAPEDTLMTRPATPCSVIHAVKSLEHRNAPVRFTSSTARHSSPSSSHAFLRGGPERSSDHNSDGVRVKLPARA